MINILNIDKNPNEQEYKEITADVIACDGYCPCVPKEKRNNNTKCICKEFKEQDFEGYCHCGRFYKHEV